MRLSQLVLGSTWDNLECQLKTEKNGVKSPHASSCNCYAKEANIDRLMMKHLLLFTTF